MLAILEDHLKQTVPVEQYMLFDRAHELFDKYDWSHAQTAFEDLMVSSDGLHGTASTTAIHDLTLEILLAITTEHQISLNNEARIEQYCTILEFIKQVEHTEFITESVNLLTTDDYNNTEKFCELISLVSGGNALEYMLFVEEIPDAVISKLKEYFTAREACEIAIEALPEENKEVYSQMETFGRTVSGKDMMSYKFLMENHGAIGMPLDFYWKLFEDYLKKLEDADMIYELIGFGMMSAGGLDDVIAVVNTLLSSKFSNIDHLIKLQNLLTTTLVEYRNEVSTGVARAATLTSN